MFYVTCTDQILSRFYIRNEETGEDVPAEVSKFVVACDTYEQADEIKRNMDGDKNLTYVNIRATKPNYPAESYRTSTKHYEVCTAYHD